MTRDARVIFRTAGADSPLPRKLPPDVLAPWTYLEAREQGRARPGPLLDLWRLPRLCPTTAVLSVSPSRASHAALMDRVYRHQRYIYDFTRKYYLFGRDSADRRLDAEARRAGDRSRLRHRAQSHQIARNLSRPPGFSASMPRPRCCDRRKRALAQAGLAAASSWSQAYAEDLSPGLFGESEPFDAIVFSYSLSMIPDWKQALRAAQRRRWRRMGSCTSSISAT